MGILNCLNTPKYNLGARGNTTLCIGSIQGTGDTVFSFVTFKYNTLYRFNFFDLASLQNTLINLNTTLCIGSIYRDKIRLEDGVLFKYNTLYRFNKDKIGISKIEQSLKSPKYLYLIRLFPTILVFDKKMLNILVQTLFYRSLL